ncbi:metal-dependent hydrolase [Parahaliea maris]|uniref:Metal-dependent hydrolase n=1 Tax=Parahaliea maris TaxID=2716870 RepID=A0A5C9A461_9GAMM|nr:metal-dependent hydrolase [Parahaliea maris]TXS95663.1 metal-dependent hydrolase [Parahaliea maris]
MDPLSQGVLGAALPQASARRREAATAGLLGFLAGMAPDLDVLIRSSEDPLLFLEYHRQFTHSLLFIPLGGLLCALVLHGVIGKRRGFGFGRTLAFCTLGYATHALLDVCTTYGTMLFWPFSDMRIAWNTVSIIDPLFTVPILLLVVMGGLRKQPVLARYALVWALAYLGMGLWQRNEAIAIGEQLAASRGHEPVRLEAKPSFGNILVWKVVYQTESEFYVDAVRTGFSPRIYPGDSVPVLNPARDLPWLEPGSQQAADVDRFSWFSNGYVALDPRHADRVIDIRYSLLPNEIAPLWSIQLDPAAGDASHVGYITHRDGGGRQGNALWAMLSGNPELGDPLSALADRRISAGQDGLGSGQGRASADGGTLAPQD